MLKLFNRDLATFLKGSLILLLFNFVAKVFRYTANVVVARNLEVTEFGLYTFFYQATGYVTVIIEFGLPTSIVYVCVRLGRNINNIISILVLYLGIVSLLLSLSAMIMISLTDIENYFGSIALIIMIAPYSIGLLATSIVLASLRALSMNNLYNLMIGQAAVVFLILILLASAQDGFSIDYAIVVSCVSLYISLVISSSVFVYMRGYVFVLDRNTLSELYFFGYKNFIYRVINTFVQFLPAGVLMFRQEVRLLGYFGVAIVFMSAIRIVSQSLSLLLTSKLSALDDKTSEEFTNHLTLTVAALFVFIAVPFIFFAQEIIVFIYGQRYTEAATISQLAIFAAMFETICLLMIRPLITSAKPSYSFVYFVYVTIAVAFLVSLYVANLLLSFSILNSIGFSMILSNLLGVIMCVIKKNYNRNMN